MFYDILGEFVKCFYCLGKDVILNVFDIWLYLWDFWVEGKNLVMYDCMVKVVILDNNGGGDLFWIEVLCLLFLVLLE